MAVDSVTEYARAVCRRGSTVPAGTLHRLACARHLREVGDPTWRRLHGLTWDPAIAEYKANFISEFRQYKGEWAGYPLALQPWQRFIVGSLHGWRRRADGLRRFRTAFVEIPRGNGKSTMAAGVGLEATFFDDEPGAEGYSVATKRDQASIVFGYARQMVLRTAALRKRIAAQVRNLHQIESACKFEALGADADTLDGLRPHVVIADEIHAHPSGKVIEVMETGMGTRRQPLLFEITTAGINRHGPWWAHREYTRAMLEGHHDDPAWFGIVFGADRDADWTDPATWAIASPGYGVQVKAEYLRDQCRKATQILTFQNTFRRLYLGQLVEQQDRFLDMGAWDRITVATDPVELEGRRCVGAIDLASRTDIAALVLLFTDDDGGVTVLPYFWCPARGVELRSRVDRVPYDAWVEAGLMRATDGNAIDYDVIRRDINAIAARFHISEIGFDPWNAMQLAMQLQGDGLVMVEVRQGFKSLSEATKQCGALVGSGRVRHGGHPILRWMAANLVTREDANGNLAPDKSKATERIDGMVALIMALARVIATDGQSGDVSGFIV